MNQTTNGKNEQILISWVSLCTKIPQIWEPANQKMARLEESTFSLIPAHESSMQSQVNKILLLCLSWRKNLLLAYSPLTSLYLRQKGQFQETYGKHFKTCEEEKLGKVNGERKEWVQSNSDSWVHMERAIPSSRRVGENSSGVLKLGHICCLHLVPGYSPSPSPFNINFSKCWLHKISFDSNVLEE